MKKILLVALLIFVSASTVYGARRFRDENGKFWVETRTEVDDTTFIANTTARSFFLDVAEGLVPGYSLRRVFGSVTGVVGTLKDVTETDTIVIDVPGGATDTAIPLELVSSSQDDSLNGTGSWKIEMYGLDSLWVEQCDTITLDGTTPVHTSTTWLRVNDLSVIANGTYGGTSAGNIFVKDTSGSVAYIMIAAGGNKAKQAFFTVPDGKTAYIFDWFPGVVATTAGDNTYQVLLRITCTSVERALLSGIFLFQEVANFRGGVVGHGLPYLKVPEHGDIKASAFRVSGSQAGKATASIQILLKDN